MLAQLPWRAAPLTGLALAGAAALAGCKTLPVSPTVRGSATDAGPPICEGAPPIERPAVAYPQIASGPFHSCVLSQSGRVACWGHNQYRQLGDGTWESRSLPTPVKGVSDAIDLAAFDGGTCVARRGGSVACWGSPWGPAPADVAGMQGVARVSAWKGAACGARQDGSVVCGGVQDGDGYQRVAVGPHDLPGIRDAIDVAVGNQGICVLHACGRVSCGSRTWVRNEDEGPRLILKPFTAVGGLDDARELVMGNYVSSGMYERACALRANGRVSCFPQTGGVAEVPAPLGDDSDFVGIGGGQSICAIGRAGRTKCFGPTLVARKRAEDPELPDEVSLDWPITVSAGASFRCATAAVDKVLCWGRALGGDSDEVHVPMAPGKLSDAAQLSVGRFQTCIARTSGEVSCWGPLQSVTVAGDHGQGGYSYITGQSMPGLHLIAEVAAGDGFVCARTRPGEVFCYGRNDKGQLGDGPRNEDRHLATPIEGILDATSLVAAPTYACALRPGGEVRCWGAHPLSERLGTKASPIFELAGAVEIAAGDRHTCARLSTGTIKCVGAAPALGRAGSADVAQVVAGASHTCVLFKSGHVSCGGAPGPTAEDLPEPAVHIAAGGSETCAVLSSGGVSCWGTRGWTAPWALVKGAKRVATSGRHACALLGTGGLVCWGDARDGALGEGKYNASYLPTEIPLPDWQ